MAAEGGPGSTVVVCTDGLANVGLGSNNSGKQAADEFYEKVGELAMSKGVTINVVSMEGEDCNMDALGNLAMITGGEVCIVDPKTLTSTFKEGLTQSFIAMRVTCKVKLHKGCQFRNEDAASLSKDLTMMTKKLGNVTADNEFTFEYCVKPLSELLAMEDIDWTKMKNLPFQAQIEYTGLDRARYLRVITN